MGSSSLRISIAITTVLLLSYYKLVVSVKYFIKTPISVKCLLSNEYVNLKTFNEMVLL